MDDRYEQNSKLFAVGLICLLLSLTLFAFSLYIMPFLIFNWSYNVPLFVITWREWLKEYHNFTDMGASWLIFLSFIIPALICGYISRRASNAMDKQITGIEEEKRATILTEEVKKDVQETLGFGFKLFLLVLLVLIAVIILEWIVAPPTTTV